MTYHNPNQPENNHEALPIAEHLPDERIAPGGIDALISALSYATTSNEAAHQPTIKALMQLVTAQLALKKAVQTSSEQMIEQKQKIDQQSQEIGKLKQQIQLQNDLLAPLMDWRKITAYIVLSGIITASYMALLQKILPPQIDSTTLEKINFLYTQERKRIPNAKK
jgi:hypothetical protein